MDLFFVVFEQSAFFNVDLYVFCPHLKCTMLRCVSSVSLQSRRAEECERPRWKIQLIHPLSSSSLLTPEKSLHSYLKIPRGGMQTLNSMFWYTSLPRTIHFVHLARRPKTRNPIIQSTACKLEPLFDTVYLYEWNMHVVSRCYQEAYVLCLPPTVCSQVVVKKGLIHFVLFLMGSKCSSRRITYEQINAACSQIRGMESCFYLAINCTWVQSHVKDL